MKKLLIFFVLLIINISFLMPVKTFAAECGDIEDLSDVNFTIYLRFYDGEWGVGINPGSTLNNGTNNGWLIEDPIDAGSYYSAELRYVEPSGYFPSVKITYEHAVDFTLWNWSTQVDTIHTRLEPDDPNVLVENIRISVQVIDETTMLFTWEQNTTGVTWVPFRIKDNITPVGYTMAVNVVGESTCPSP